MVSYIQLIPTDLTSDKLTEVENYTWLDYTCKTQHPKNGRSFVLCDHNDRYYDFAKYLNRIAIQKCYNHYLVKTSDCLTLKLFMIAYFSHNDIASFKSHFRIGNVLENRKAELLRKNRVLHYVYKHEPRRVYRKSDRWFIILRDSIRELTDDEIMNGSFVDE